MPDSWFEKNMPSDGWFEKNVPGNLKPMEKPGAWQQFTGALGNAVSGLNPLAIMAEYVSRPGEYRKALRGYQASVAAKDREPTPEEAAEIEAGQQARVGNPMGYTPPVGSEPALQAIQQGLEGKPAAAAGTMVGGYAVPAGLAKAAPSLGRGAYKMADLLRATPEKLYQGALKAPPSWYTPEERSALVNQALNKNYPASSAGLEKAAGRVEDINKTVAKTIAEDPDAALKTVDPVAVAKQGKRTMKAMETVDPTDLSEAKNVRSRFLKKHSYDQPYTKIRPSLEGEGFVPAGTRGNPEALMPNRKPEPMPVAQAQREKSNTYRVIRDEKYGQQTSQSGTEMKKDLAHGLAEGVYENYPELRALGKEEKIVIDLRDALERLATRYGNHDVMSLGGPAKMAALGKPAGTIAAFLEMPAVKSRIAIAARQARLALQRRGVTPGRVAGTVVASQSDEEQ